MRDRICAFTELVLCGRSQKAVFIWILNAEVSDGDV